jgi:peptide/nickel transport system permease protein
MLRYIIRRLLYLVLVMFVITMVTYLIFYKLPSGDPAIRFAGKSPTPAVVAEVRKQFGLDKPLYQQYGTFMWRLFAGDKYGWPGFGFSFDTRSPVREALFSRIGVTMQLGAGAAVLWVLLGVPLGILSALKRRTFVDRATMGFALFGVSAPVFAVGLAALYIFWQKLGITALGTGYVAPSDNLGAFFGHMILPWSVLALQYAAFYARMVRSNLLETLGEDYIRTARAKGLSERKVIGKHGLRASLTPVVTIFGMDFSLLIGGAVLTESVFNLPGLGQLIISSVNRQDIPVVLATTIVAAFFVSFMSLVVDILYGYLDPRVRFS